MMENDGWLSAWSEPNVELVYQHTGERHLPECPFVIEYGWAKPIACTCPHIVGRPTPPIEPEAEPLTAIDRAIRDHLFATAIREEAELIKELAPSHHCESHWAGNHCTVCSAHKGTALRTAERFNAYVAAQSADIDRLTRERDTWRQRAEEAEEVVTGVVEDRDAYANTLKAITEVNDRYREALKAIDRLACCPTCDLAYSNIVSAALDGEG